MPKGVLVERLCQRGLQNATNIRKQEVQHGRCKFQPIHGPFIHDRWLEGAVSMNDDDTPESRLKLSLSLNPRMTWLIGFVTWESGGKLFVSLVA